MGDLSPEDLRAILEKLDALCRQAQELQRQVKQEMVRRARENDPARSAAPVSERRSKSPKSRQ